ncbi:MAG: S-layer homology domain-containing protein [Candidatus Eremiobacteraeota bacterium]|nr:S-layer homology domain-containing protein [Candidatus Eremiobacteraeota bacterium]
MKRPLCVLAAAVLLAAWPALVHSAPLSDVAPSDWAYHSIASLSARGIINGYPDGRFHGDQPATRKEMAAVVSRTLAQAEVEAAPRSDLQRTGQLIDALKDELDALSVRVGSLEERLATPQPQAFSPQAAIRRVPRGSSALAQDAGLREMTQLQRHPDAALTRSQLAVFSANALRELNARDASKNDVEQAHRMLSTLSDRLNSLSARVARFDAAQDIQRPQPMMRNQRGTFAPGEVFDRSALRWARLNESVVGSVVGIAFHVVDATVAPAQYGLIGQSVFGVAPINVPVFDVASQTIVSPQSVLAMSTYSGKGWASFGYAAPLGATLAMRTFTSPSGLGDLLKTSTSPALTQLNASGDAAQISVPATTIALPALGADRASSFAVPSFGVPQYAQGGETPAALNVPQLRVNFTIPARFGGSAVQSNFGLAHLQGLDRNAGVQSCSILPALCAAAFGSGSFQNQVLAGTTFDVRALGRSVSLNFGGSYEQMHRPAGTAFPYVPYDPAADNHDSALTNISPVTFDPSYVDVLKRTLNAAAAVPLSRDLTLNLQYDKEYYNSSYQSFGQNVDEQRDSYLGRLTYTFPSTANTLVFSAKQYHYRDAFLPTYNLTQNRADLNFTIKF